MKHIVYYIRSQCGGYRYTGMTANLGRRLREHNSNQNKSTKNKGPWNLVCTKYFEDRRSARNFEKYFKSGWGRDRISRDLNP